MGTIHVASAMLALCCVWTLGARAAVDVPVTFRFAPPESVAFTQTLETVRDRTIEGAGQQTDRSVSVTDLRLERRGGGYVMVARPVSMLSMRNGQPVADPVGTLLHDLVVTYYLSADGQIDSIAGYGDLATRIRESLPPEAAAAVAPILNEDVLVQREVAEWNGRVGDFVGATVAVGDSIDATAPYPLPNGDTLTFVTRTWFRRQEPCASKQCLLIESRFDSDAEAVARLSAGVVEKITGESLHAGASRVSGSSTRLIDPRTMLIYDESARRTIVMTMNVPGIGPTRTTLVEDRHTTYTYR